MEHKLKISQIVVEQERSTYQPGRPGELPKQVTETFLVPIKVTAHSNLRFAHLLIDGFLIFTINAVFVMSLFGIKGFDLFSVPMLNWWSVIFFVGYFWGFEYFLQATPGKMATGCIVIDEYGERPSIWQILGRTAIRYIPFDALSFLGQSGRGWHDDWPETYVILKKDLPHILEAKQKQEEEFLNKKRSTVQN